MYTDQFLHKMLCDVMHLKRLNTFKLLLNGLMNDKKLSVTELGRSLENKAQEKNNIKCSDRFMSNIGVWKERFSIYKSIALSLINTNLRPLIIVDWSHIPNTTAYLLRAAFVAKGRALTLYEEVFSQRLENNPQVHVRFLKKIRKILPDGCTPIIITDAGFSTPWFQQVQSLGWDYVGRIRGSKCFKIKGTQQWHNYSDYRATVTQHIARYLGESYLTKEHRFDTHLYETKLPKKYRTRLNKLKKKGHYKSDIEHGKAANEPWLIATSLKKSPQTIIKMYFFRMEIEEGFRDLKSSQFGFSFEKAHSFKIRRIQVLLMIAMVAAAILFFIGWAAEIEQWHLHFQANTIKNRRVLSLFYLGGRIFKKRKCISNALIVLSLHQLQHSVPWMWEEKL